MKDPFKRIFFLFLLIVAGCAQSSKEVVGTAKTTEPATKIPVIFDTDANNELDDQHAMAYLFFNGDVFDIIGVTVNATYNGGAINQHYAEADRVMKLCRVDGKFPLLAGANGSYEEIKDTTGDPEFDGSPAVNFIISEARKPRDQKLVLIPVGKLTNIALALQIAPDIMEKVRIVWLGSNYPEPGEYNQVNDIPSLIYVLEQKVPFEIVTVRYGDPSGSDAVRVTPEQIAGAMPGMGPSISPPVTGRHGSDFTNFGDYSVSLFEHIDLHGDPPARALFDMVAVAVLKNPDWGEQYELSAPKLDGENWVDQPENSRKITIWQNFNGKAILMDFYDRMKNYQLPN